MGKVARERYAAEFKVNVAPEAIRGELTLTESAVDKPRAEAIDDRTGASVSVDRAAVRIGAPTGETPSNLAPMRLIDE